jgi:hypothetical protein
VNNSRRFFSFTLICAKQDGIGYFTNAGVAIIYLFDPRQTLCVLQAVAIDILSKNLLYSIVIDLYPLS